MINKKILYLYVVVTYDNVTNGLLPLKQIFNNVIGYDYLTIEQKVESNIIKSLKVTKILENIND